MANTTYKKRNYTIVTEILYTLNDVKSRCTNFQKKITEPNRLNLHTHTYIHTPTYICSHSNCVYSYRAWTKIHLLTRLVSGRMISFSVLTMKPFKVSCTPRYDLHLYYDCVYTSGVFLYLCYQHRCESISIGIYKLMFNKIKLQYKLYSNVLI